jgi:hypothetical protein
VTLAGSRPWLLLALLCVLAYAPALFLPLFDDDYPLITEAQRFGSPEGLPELLRTTLFRFRATSFWLVNALWRMFGLTPVVYHAASLVLHIANTFLFYRVALGWPRMRPAASWAAIFFAVQEGHQEAVMWFAAINEPLMFLFGMGALLCWMEARRGGRGWVLDLAGVLLFALALLSKESAVVLPMLFLLAAPREWRRLLPYFALSALAVLSILATRDTSFRFTDGSFSLDAPFWITWPRGIARLLWFWGLLSVIALAISGGWKHLVVPLVWIGTALVPYSFLTYSTEIPSRQTYLASAGLVLLFGLAVTHAVPQRLAAGVMVALVLHNVGYLWIRKRAQFVERAEPTEQLIRLAKETAGPIWVQCFPTNQYIAQEAVHLAAGREPSDLIWSEAEARDRKPSATFCYKR